MLDNLDWLSGWKNLSEILLGYYQHYGGTNEYSYCNLFRRMDKICHSDKPHYTVASCARGLYRNPMLCERLAGRTRILLKGKWTPEMLKLSVLQITHSSEAKNPVKENIFSFYRHNNKSHLLLHLK